ncbi:MAG: helix-turn-helix transcriptional regulator [Pseudomonadota bacterium]
MRDTSSLFARKLKCWRADHGTHGRMTQQELAERLDVSVEAIGKYERSVSFIRGDLEHRLAERLNWSRSDITACREDWELRRQSAPRAQYRILDETLVQDLYDGSWADAVAVENNMSARQFQNLPRELAADDRVFGPIYTRYHDQWRGVMYRGEMVASWVVLLLFPEDEEKFRAGRLIEAELTMDSIRQPILPGTYFGYSTAVVVCPGHEAASPLLMSSFTAFLEDLARRDVLFHSIGTTAVSPGGNQLCRDLGMIRLGAHSVSAEYGVWELTGARIAQSVFARRSPLLSRRYQEAFGE